MRLGLTVMLGLLGAWLMPVQRGFFPHVSAGHYRVALFAWLIVAVAGVLLLHRGIRVPTHLRLFVYMGLALAIALVGIPSSGMNDPFDCLSLAKITLIAFFVLMAGFTYGSQSSCRPTCSMIYNTVRGIALAVASPLLLFTSRPQGEGLFGVSVRAGFLLFLCALASPLLSLGRDHYPRFMWNFVNVDDMILMCQSFSHWAWLGCAVVSVLTPWPEILRFSDPEKRGKSNRIQFLTVPGLATAALALLAILKWRIFLVVLSYSLLLLYLNWHAFVLLLITTPYRCSFRVPKLQDLDPKARMGTLGTALFLGVALVPLALWCGPDIGTLVTGKLFTEKIFLMRTGWVLDQSTIQSGYCRFILLGGMMSAYVAVARWLCNRSSLPGYWAFALPTAGLCFCLLSYLTCVFYSLAAYIHTLGFTLLRIYGLAFGVGCYIMTALFVWWALKRPDKIEED